MGHYTKFSLTWQHDSATEDPLVAEIKQKMGDKAEEVINNMNRPKTDYELISEYMGYFHSGMDRDGNNVLFFHKQP